jgi:hypothetical protein
MHRRPKYAGTVLVVLEFFLVAGAVSKRHKKVKLCLQQAVEAQGCEMSRLPQSLDNRLTDGGEVICLMQEYSWYSFLLDAELTSEP